MAGHPDRVAPKRALLSVSDKTGLVEFARALADRGVELLTTGGHDHLHLGALIAQPTYQLRTLICGNAAADAENDAFPIQPLHRFAL